jgi:ubiquinone/menaquinone biosynthesis C-methylase UbiE
MMDKIDERIYEPYLSAVDKAIETLNDKAVLLDAGCGHSKTLENQYKRCSRVIGIDLDKEGLEKNKLIDEKYYADMGMIPVDDSSIGIYTSAWVLEHVENPIEVVDEAYRVLEKEGFFIFIAPNKNSIYALLVRLIPHKFHEIVTTKLYGRGDGDTFKAFYKMNSEKDLDQLFDKDRFEKISIIFNDDPKYFGFSKYTQFFARIWHRFIMKDRFAKFRVHIIGVYKKI